MKIGSTFIAFIASFTIPLSTWCGIELANKDFLIGLILLGASSALDFTCIKLGYDFLKQNKIT